MMVGVDSAAMTVVVVVPATAIGWREAGRAWS